MRRNSGFTLIELMIVICIILILAVLALPALFRSKLQTNEATAVGNLRTICSAQISYHGTHTSFADFADLTTIVGVSPFLEGNWSDGVDKSGYTYNMTQVSDANFVCYADPTVFEQTGVKFYSVDASGVIHWNATERPSDTDPILGGG